jgi:hypothetical protein
MMKDILHTNKNTCMSAFRRYAAKKRREVFLLLGSLQSSTVSMICGGYER